MGHYFLDKQYNCLIKIVEMLCKMPPGNAGARHANPGDQLVSSDHFTHLKECCQMAVFAAKKRIFGCIELLI